jgi:hypothetical protein
MDRRWTGVPGPIGRFAHRRRLDGARHLPGWALAQAGARWWAGAQVDRRYRVAFAERALTDAWAAHRLAGLAVPPRAVVACTGAALRTFAAAARRGARTALVADLPWLRRLHADLDRAAATLPERTFLRRFRAPRDAIVRQGMERAQAELIAVRGHYADALCVEAGVDAARIVALPAVAAVTRASATMPTGAAPHAVLLAGLATARGGIDAALDARAALAARAALPALRLRVRTGDGTEPRDVLTRPGVEPIAGDPWRDVLALIAPAWCETYAPEVDAAIARGVPVIASRAAAGFAAVRIVPPGDGAALAAALASVGDATFVTSVPPPLPDLATALRR